MKFIIVEICEPNATKLVNEGYGFIADSVGTYSGEVPYTAFNALESYIDKNPKTIKTFYTGIEKGLEYCQNNSAKKIAETIAPQFPDTDIEELTTMIDNYKKADSWLKTPEITKESFNNLQDILLDNNEIEQYVDYKDLIYDVNKS